MDNGDNRYFEEKFDNLHYRLTEIRDEQTSQRQKLENLPCGAHEERISGVAKWVGLQWGVLGILLSLIVWIAIAG